VTLLVYGSLVRGIERGNDLAREVDDAVPRTVGAVQLKICSS
jgi:hypothetical protein